MIIPSAQHLLDTLYSFGTLSAGKPWVKPEQAQGRAAQTVGQEHLCKKATGAGPAQPGEERALGGLKGHLQSQQGARPSRRGGRLLTAQHGGGGNERTGLKSRHERFSPDTRKKHFPLWGQSGSGTGWPGKLHSLHLGRFSRSSWEFLLCTWLDHKLSPLWAGDKTRDFPRSLPLRIRLFGGTLLQSGQSKFKCVNIKLKPQGPLLGCICRLVA